MSILYTSFNWYFNSYKISISDGLQLPMTGILDEFENIPEKPFTFNELMNVIRDIATLVNNRLKKSYSDKISIEREKSDKESIENKGEGDSKTKRNNAITNSLEEKLHQLVQYLIYFRNTDGSFGEPIVEQNLR